jgi:carbonic anhydrase
VKISKRHTTKARRETAMTRAVDARRQPHNMKIVEATENDMPTVRKLFREYQEWLGVDLCFQGFDEELATLPGSYAPPTGVIFIAIEDNEAVGCVGIRPRMDNEAELKRLYVRPGHQGRGIGKQLFHTAMTRAKRIGYTSIVLDTLPAMQTAKSLYVAYGFKEIPAYYGNPEEGVEYYRYVFG